MSWLSGHLLAIGFGLLALVVSAEPAAFNLQRMPLSQLVSLYFSEVHQQPFVLCDALLKDQRLVSVRAAGPQLDSAILQSLLTLNGYEARQQQGVTLVSVKSMPLTTGSKEIAASTEVPFVYRPQYREVNYLVGLLSTIVQGIFANQAVSAPAPAVGGDTKLSGQTVSSTYQVRDDDCLLFSGSAAQVKRLQGLLRQLDVPEASILVKAVLYEIKRERSQGSALKLVADLLKCQHGLSIGSDRLVNSLSIKAHNFDVVASAISSDGRFRVMTSPFARIKNHQSVRLQVGQDVPVAGQILLNPNGQTTQSTEYHSSGVILNVMAHIRGQVVDLDVVQTVSNFIKTTIGSNANPTMNKREIQTAISLANGEMVLLGGLLDSQSEDAKSGLFGCNFSKTKSSMDSELILLIQAERL